MFDMRSSTSLVHRIKPTQKINEKNYGKLEAIRDWITL